jgi:hypothetical protein
MITYDVFFFRGLTQLPDMDKDVTKAYIERHVTGLCAREHIEAECRGLNNPHAYMRIDAKGRIDIDICD